MYVKDSNVGESALGFFLLSSSQKKMDKNVVRDALAKAEQDTQKNNISDQKKYLIEQKIEVLKNLTLN